MATLCFGGSFNPIHHGHLICARAVAERSGFDRILLIPNRQPPHKQNVSGIAPAEHRFAMCQIAVQQDQLFQVSDIEISRPGPSYTIETARQLRAAGHGEVAWLIGADMATSLPQWHQPDQLLAEVRFVLMARPGWRFDWTSMPLAYRRLQQNVVEAPLLEISSTIIRDRISKNLSVHYMTPTTVIDYIADHRLYR